MEGLAPIRSKVLEEAHIKTGQTLLDVGCGDGLIGFGALDKLGADGSVIFSDISEKLLDVCREAAEGMGVLDRCTFVKADATDLSQIPTATVDVVTTRSVLIYVADKQKAFNEFARVLRPGGWLSIFEPVAKIYNQFNPPGTWMGFDVRPIRIEIEKMIAAWKPDEVAQDTMGDFDDRDLFQMALTAGFDQVFTELNYCVRKGNMLGGNWETFLNSSPNPLAPTFGERFSKVFSQEEMQNVEACMRPQIEAHTGKVSQAIQLLSAQKPMA